jgi:hypothetical protein
MACDAVKRTISFALLYGDEMSAAVGSTLLKKICLY